MPTEYWILYVYTCNGRISRFTLLGVAFSNRTYIQISDEHFSPVTNVDTISVLWRAYVVEETKLARLYIKNDFEYDF